MTMPSLFQAALLNFFTLFMDYTYIYIHNMYYIYMDLVLSTSHFPIFGMVFSFFSDPHRDHLTVIMAPRLEHPSRAYFSDISQLCMDVLRQ